MMRTIEESRAILERWAKVTGGTFGWPIIRADYLWEAWVSDGTVFQGHAEAEVLSAVVDWALQDCPEIAACCPHDDDYHEIGRGCRASVGVERERCSCTEESRQSAAPTPKYPAPRCSHESAMDQLRRVRDRGGPFLCMGSGHESILEFRTFDALVAHCAEHDVSEFFSEAKPPEAMSCPKNGNHGHVTTWEACRACNPVIPTGAWSPPPCSECGGVVEPWTNDTRPLVCDKCVRGDGKRAAARLVPARLCSECGLSWHGDGRCCVAANHEAALAEERARRARHAHAEAAERTLAKYLGYTPGDLKAKRDALHEAELRMDHARLARGTPYTVKEARDHDDACDAWTDLDAAIRWLEEGKPR